MWIKTANELPPDETPVLIILNGEIRIGELRWEHPSWEETYEAFRYWDNPNDDGQIWEWHDVTHWQYMPEIPRILTINKLHDLTGRPRIACVEALNKCEWDLHKAVDILKEG